jgi:hypothetical protein
MEHLGQMDYVDHQDRLELLDQTEQLDPMDYLDQQVRQDLLESVRQDLLDQMDHQEI